MFEFTDDDKKRVLRREARNLKLFMSVVPSILGSGESYI